MPSAPDILNAIDDRVEELLGYIAAKQGECLTEYGTYFQSLPTHTVLPRDGAVVQPDNLNAKPSDQEPSWADVGYPIANPVASTRIDTYSGIYGIGYIVRISLIIGGFLWTRSINFGGDVAQEYPWGAEYVGP